MCYSQQKKWRLEPHRTVIVVAETAKLLQKQLNNAPIQNNANRFRLIDIHIVILKSVTHPFNGPLPGSTRVSRYQKGKTDLDLILLKQETVSGSDISWAICKSTPRCQTDNHASTPPLCFLQAVCPSCCPTNSVKALKALKSFITLTTRRCAAK